MGAGEPPVAAYHGQLIRARTLKALGIMKKPKRRVSERSLHSTIADWLRLVLPNDAVWTHVPGEGKRGWIGQRDLLTMGYKAGWPDISIIYGGRAYFAEIKTKDGEVTPVQIACHQDIRKAGCPVAIVYSVEDLRDFLIAHSIPLGAVYL